MGLNNTKALMIKYADELVQEIQEAMQQTNKYGQSGTQNLYKEVSSEIKISKNGIAVLLIAPKEVYFASEGRAPGKFPPEAPILKWIKQRNIKFRNKKGQFIADRATSFLIRRKIAVKGTKENAPHFLSEFKLTDKMLNNVVKAYAGDVMDDIELFLKKNLKPGAAGIHRV